MKRRFAPGCSTLFCWASRRCARRPGREASSSGWSMSLPKSRAEIRGIQSRLKLAAAEQAGRSAFWKKRLPKLNLENLDEEWRKIPILDKDTLRALSDTQFYSV